MPNTFSESVSFFKIMDIFISMYGYITVNFKYYSSSYVLPNSLEEQEEEDRVKATLPNTTDVVVANFRK